MICPNSDSCKEHSQRGILEDHLKYRCDGTLVACQFAGAGCIFRGPVKKMKDHQLECNFKKEGEGNERKEKATLILCKMAQFLML